MLDLPATSEPLVDRSGEVPVGRPEVSLRIVAALLWLQRGSYDELTDSLHGGPVGYALTQPVVIMHYVRLAFWPVGQCLDYEWPIARTPSGIIPPLAAVLTALGIAALKRALPGEDPQIAVARYVRASTHMEQRRFEEAVSECEAIVDRLAAILGDGDAATIGCRNILAAAANRRGDAVSAERLARQNLAASRAARGGWYPGSQIAASLLAAAVESQGRPVEAERILRRVLAEIDAVAWWRSVDASTAGSSLAALLERQGRHADSIPLRAKILDEASLRYGSDAEPTRRAARELQAVHEMVNQRPRGEGSGP